MTACAITGFRLVTHDPSRLVRFYAAMGFVAGPARPIPNEEMGLLGLPGGGMRTPMTLAGSALDIDAYDRRGRAYPDDASAADRCFQHLALATDDAATAWDRIRAIGGATPISRDGPIRLPASTGGVTAMKFRDPDGHPLELLQFPPGDGRRSSGSGILGVDHSAISVADVDASRRFYEALGLAVGERTFNHGPTQVALDGLDGVEVDVVALTTRDDPPHLELLGYRSPRGRADRVVSVNDVAATRIVWRAGRDAVERDPDGHFQQMTRG